MQNDYQFHWENIITKVCFSNSSHLTEITHFKEYLLVVLFDKFTGIHPSRESEVLLSKCYK